MMRTEGYEWRRIQMLTLRARAQLARRKRITIVWPDYATFISYPCWIPRAWNRPDKAAMNLVAATWDVGKILMDLVPVAIGAAVGGPMWIIMALLLLRSNHGVIKAASFAAGAIAVRMLQFVLFSRIFGAVLDSGGESEMGLMYSILLLLGGIVLLITAVKTWFKEIDPDAPPSKWLAALSGVSAPTAFGMAVVMMFLGFKQWVFTLSAIAIIDEADLGKFGSVLLYLLFIATAQALMLAPIIVSALLPGKSSRMVGATLGWLERNSRGITVAVSLIFGVWFLSKSAAGFLVHRSELFSTETLTN